jgi:hypothetical protein
MEGVQHHPGPIETIEGSDIQNLNQLEKYSESAQKTLLEIVHFFYLWKIRGNLEGKVGWSDIRFIQKKNANNFLLFLYFLETN